ncbi:hypothetical protein HPB50_018540 [Hyalomma asiaticum]|uniref:Uncharacterized protein n=1 Tax=Hyalomma asiaticum TaxID=266040 RepID=A0ACB7TKP6_HYAAI|nr:hypothetical protein HPB50_018540 [Hyalomma asiaticum]
MQTRRSATDRCEKEEEARNERNTRTRGFCDYATKQRRTGSDGTDGHTAAPTNGKNGTSFRSSSEVKEQRNRSRSRRTAGADFRCCVRTRQTRGGWLGSSRLFGPWAVMDACSQSQCLPNTSAAAEREVNTVPACALLEAADVSQSRICPALPRSSPCALLPPRVQGQRGEVSRFLLR